MLLQPLTKLSRTLQVHAKANPLPRPTAAAHGGARLGEWHTGRHLLGAAIHLFAIPSPVVPPELQRLWEIRVETTVPGAASSLQITHQTIP